MFTDAELPPFTALATGLSAIRRPEALERRQSGQNQIKDSRFDPLWAISPPPHPLRRAFYMPRIERGREPLVANISAQAIVSLT